MIYYRFTRHDFPTETSPITIAFAIFKDTRFVLHERLTIGSKSLSLYFVISDENGGGQLLTYKTFLFYYLVHLSQNLNFQQYMWLKLEINLLLNI